MTSMLTRADRAFLRMYGRDPLRIIQGIITNDVANAAADRVVYGAFLTPKGRMIADVRVIRAAPQELLLDVPAAAVGALLEMFKKTVAPLFARVEDVTAQYALVGAYGADARTVVTSVLGDMPEIAPADGYALLRGAGAGDDQSIHVMSTREAGVEGYELVLPSTHAAEYVEKLQDAGASIISGSTFDVMRIEAGTPRWGAELDENTIPLEAGLLARGIATNKGCYTGQEVIVRIMHRGHVNWNLNGFLIGDAPPPAPGEMLTLPGQSKNVARITSAAFSEKLGQTIALGYLRREIQTPAELQLANGATATAVALPFQTADIEETA